MASMRDQASLSIAFIGAALMAAAPAAASTQSFTTTYALSTGSNNIAGFDSSLGTLTSIMYNFSYTAIGFEQGFGIANPPNPVTTTATLSLAGPFGLSTSSSTVTNVPFGIYVFNPTYSGSETVSYSDQGSLVSAMSPYIETFSSSQTVTGGQYQEVFAFLNPTASLTVTYNYSAATVSPVPEPATWAMMTIGMGMMGFAMRRRQTATGRFSRKRVTV
jgi:hypothetical protein